MPLLSPEPIDTARLRVRLVAEADLPALLEVNGDDDVTRFLPYASWRTLEDAQAWHKRMMAAQETGLSLQFVIVEKASGIAVGTCLLFRYDEKSARAELGYVLRRSHWGKGYALEALAALVEWAFGPAALRRLEAEIDPRNCASSRLLLRLGFHAEGLQRERWADETEVTDSALYGLLRGDWEARSKQGAPAPRITRPPTP